MKQKTKKLCACMCILGLFCTLQPVQPAIADVAETSDWYNTDKTMVITPGADTGGSGSKEAQYKLGDTADWTTYSTPITVTETTTVHMRTLDNAGNISELRSLTVQIDRDAPTEPDIIPSSTITNTDITYTITDGADPAGGSGIDHSEYQVQSAGTPADDTAWQAYTNEQSISGEGQYVIYARTLDIAGNSSPVATVEVEIDITPPDKPLITPPGDGTSNDDIIITLPVGDGCIYTYQVVAADTPYLEDAWLPVIDGSITLTDEGIWDLYVKAADLAGNSSISDPCRIIIDRTVPVINTVTKSTDTYTEQPVIVTIDATDNIQIAGYTFDGGTTWLTDNFSAFTDNITIAAADLQVKDIGGNITTYADAGGSDIVINTIGKVPPAKPGIEGDYNSNDSVDIEVDISDPALSYTYQIVPANTPNYDDAAWLPVPDTGLIHFDEEGIWHLYLRVHDGISYVVSDPILIVIDKTSPTTPSITEDKLDSKTVKVLVADGSDALSGIRVTHIYINGEDKTVESKMRTALRELLFDKAGTYEIKAQSEDMVGNLSPEATHTVTIKSSSNNSSDEQPSNQNTTTIYNGAFAGGKDSNGAALILQPNITVKSRNGYIGGYDDSTFKPERNITKAEFAAILNRIISVNTQNKLAPQYTDVKPTHWAYTDISSLQRLDIIPSAGTYFYPDQPITREEISASLDKVLNLSKYPANTSELTDIQTCTYRGAVAKVYNAGIVVGYQDDTFKPANSLTRAECVAMLNRTFGIKTSNTAAKQSRFKDVSMSHWAYEEILSASYKK